MSESKLSERFSQAFGDTAPPTSMYARQGEPQFVDFCRENIGDILTALLMAEAPAKPDATSVPFEPPGCPTPSACSCTIKTQFEYGRPISKVGGKTTAHGFFAGEVTWPPGSGEKHPVLAYPLNGKGWWLHLYGPGQLVAREGKSTRDAVKEAVERERKQVAAMLKKEAERKRQNANRVASYAMENWPDPKWEGRARKLAAVALDEMAAAILAGEEG